MNNLTLINCKDPVFSRWLLSISQARRAQRAELIVYDTITSNHTQTSLCTVYYTILVSSVESQANVVLVLERVASIQGLRHVSPDP